MKTTFRKTVLKTIAALSLAFTGSQAFAAGNVTVTVVNDELRVVGDGSANDIKIEQTLVNRYRVSGLAGTKINGRSSDVFRVKKGVRVDLKGGNDTLRIQGEGPGILVDNIDGALNVDMGQGSDKVILTFLVIKGQTNLNMGDGPVDTVNVAAVVAKDSGFSVVTGNGKDEINLGLLAVDNGLNVFTQGNEDSVSLLNCSADFIGLDTGNENDQVEAIATDSFGDWEIVTGNGDDTVELENNSIASALNIATQDGDDQVSLTGVDGTSLLTLMGDDDDNLALTDVTFDDALVDGENDDNFLVLDGDIDIGDFTKENFDE